MPTREHYASLPVAQRLARLARTADDLAVAMRERGEAEISRRPDPKNWSAKEVICHLRDIEELCLLRFRMMLAMDDPKILAAGAMPRNPAEWGLDGTELPIDPDRWAEERQYARCDGSAALSAFRQRRDDSLRFFARLAPEQWPRGCIAPSSARVTFTDWTALMPGHDDNHLDQLIRALDGRA